jgi:hypothetical protein
VVGRVRDRLDAEVMRTTIAFLILATVILALVIYWAREQEATYALPMVKASSCQKLANPCDRVNCNRVNTKVIA